MQSGWRSWRRSRLRERADLGGASVAGQTVGYSAALPAAACVNALEGALLFLPSRAGQFGLALLLECPLKQGQRGSLVPAPGAAAPPARRP